MSDSRRLRYFLGALFMIVMVVLTMACAPAPHDKDGRRAPSVAPDPNPVGSAGRDEKSVQLYVAWLNEYEKIIDYQDGTVAEDGTLLHTFNQRAQTPKGGSVAIASLYRPKTFYDIEATPKEHRENRGLTYCWILWKNKIQTRDTRTDGKASCSWRSS